MTLRSLEIQDPTPRRHSCVSCGGSFTSTSDAPRSCHGGSSCPLDEPDNWETYEPDPSSSYGIGALTAHCPNALRAPRLASPFALGLGWFLYRFRLHQCLVNEGNRFFRRQGWSQGCLAQRLSHTLELLFMPNFHSAKLIFCRFCCSNKPDCHVFFLSRHGRFYRAGILRSNQLKEAVG